MSLKEKISDISAIGGDPVYLLFILLAFAGNLKKELFILIAAWLLAYAITAAIRFTWWQERPDKEKYENLWQKFDSGSFPSLHAARATILIATLIIFYHNIFATIFFAAAAFGVCAARILLKRHRLGDVIAGVVLGLIVRWLAPQIINALNLL